LILKDFHTQTNNNHTFSKETIPKPISHLFLELKLFELSLLLAFYIFFDMKDRGQPSSLITDYFSEIPSIGSQMGS
jgi:hypothetical protein